MPDPDVEDPFVTESIDAPEDDDFDLVKGIILQTIIIIVNSI